MRERRGWSRTELARRAGIGRMVESRIERGETNLDIDALHRIGLAMDRPLLVTFGRDMLDGPADAGHLGMQELVLRLGRPAGFVGSFELPTRSNEPWRSVDVGLIDEAGAADHPRRVLEHVRGRRSRGAIDQSKAVGARSDERGPLGTWHRRRRRGERRGSRGRGGAAVGSVWVVRATARNRALIQRYPGDLRIKVPRLVPGMGRGLDPRGGDPGRAGSRVVRCRRDPDLRVAPALSPSLRREGQPQTPCYTRRLTATTERSNAGTARSERGMV